MAACGHGTGAGMKPADDDDESEDDDADDDDDDDDDSDGSDKPQVSQKSTLAPPRPPQAMPAKTPGNDDFKMGYPASLPLLPPVSRQCSDKSMSTALSVCQHEFLCKDGLFLSAH